MTTETYDHSSDPNFVAYYAAESQTVGGSKCTAAWGLGLALGAAALSPCSVVCAALAWYDLALIGAFCD